MDASDEPDGVDLDAEDDAVEREILLERDAEWAHLDMLAHDLRTPLQILAGEHQQIKKIFAQHNINYDMRTINDCMETLNDGSKESGWIVRYGTFPDEAELPPKTRIPVAQLMRSIRSHTARVAQDHSKIIHFPPTHLTILSHELIIKRILLNLVTNAYKHSKGNSIVVGVRKKGNLAEFVVADSGAGPSDFHRDVLLGKAKPPLPSTKKDQTMVDMMSTDHRGLGLYIVYKATKTLGGHVELSEPNPDSSSIDLSRLARTGKRFIVKVVIPCDPKYEDIRAVESLNFYSPDALPLAGKTILILDDDKRASGVVRKSFAALGATTYAERDPRAFLDLLEREFVALERKPDLLILDFFLEHETVAPTWLAVLKLFQDSPPAAILLTGASWENEMSPLGPHMPWIAKPLGPTHVTAICEALLAPSGRSFSAQFDVSHTAARIRFGSGI